MPGFPARRGDDQFGALGQGVAVAEADGDAERPEFGGLFTRACVVAVVDDGDGRAARVQHPGRRDAGYAEPGDGDVLALEVRGHRGGHLSAAHPA
ncbi:hypothetical protein GCM10020256_57830 [Streptomyces thermocoprophilus]